MSESQWIECLVLRRWDYGEKDQIISLMSREKGRIQGIAKGAKVSMKRFGPALDLFSWIRLQVKERKNTSLFFLEQAQVISNFPLLRQDYASILIASGLLELAQALFKEGIAEEAAFGQLLDSLRSLETQGPKKRIFWAFLIKALEILGWGLHLERCGGCSASLEKQACRFDVVKSCAYCSDCVSAHAGYFQLSTAATAWMQRRGEETLLGFEDEKSLQELLERYCEQHLHISPDWSRFLRI